MLAAVFYALPENKKDDHPAWMQLIGVVVKK